jgi:catalase
LVDSFTRFYLQTNQGVKNLTSARATELAGTDPDYATRDLYNAIALGEFPSWTFYIQVMTFEQAEKFRWNPFDLTKVILF